MKWDEMAVVGRVARPHGLRGHVVVNPETDFPEDRFRRGAELFVNRSGRVEAVSIDDVRFQRERPVVAFLGIGDVDAARQLAGEELRVPREQLQRLPAGTYYWHDLVGCQVETADGRLVGEVTAVDASAGVSCLVVRGARGEVLIPLAREICPSIDTASRRIAISPPEGLLELNTEGALRKRGG